MWFCADVFCALLINRKYMLIQQYCFWFIIQTNEALLLSKQYLLSDNEKPGYHQPLLSFTLLVCQNFFVSVCSLKII